MIDPYDLVANDYDKSFELLPVRLHIEAYSVMAALGDVRDQAVLDVGCGTGFYSRAAHRAGAARVLGLDLSPEMIRFAQGAEQAAPLGIEYRVGDANQLDTIDSFDVALGVHLLHYASSLDSLAAMCAGLARNLKPGGRFVGVVMNPQPPPADDTYRSYGLHMRQPDASTDGAAVHFRVEMGGALTPEFTAYRFRRPTLEAALTAAGFSDIAWPGVRVSAQGLQQHGAEYWAPYLAHPHAVVLQCRKGT